MQDTDATIDHVVAFQQRLRRGVAHAVDLFVDLRVFLDIGVGARNIGLRLVVIVVAETKYSTALSGKKLFISP